MKLQHGQTMSRGWGSQPPYSRLLPLPTLPSSSSKEPTASPLYFNVLFMTRAHHANQITLFCSDCGFLWLEEQGALCLWHDVYAGTKSFPLCFLHLNLKHPLVRISTC